MLLTVSVGLWFLPPGAAGPVTQGPPPSGSRTEALHLADSLVAHVALPPGSARLSGPVPPVFHRYGPPSASIPDLAVASALWTAPEPMDRVSVLTSARPPAGTRIVARERDAVPGQPPAEVVDYALTAAPPGIADGRVRVLIAPGRYGGSLVLAVALVPWYPPRSPAEYVPLGMRTVTVSVTIAGSRPRVVARTFTSLAVVSRLAGLLNAMPATPFWGPRSCVVGWASYGVAFAAGPGSPPGLIAGTRACGSIAVTAGGMAQPPLDDQTAALSRAAASLLGLKSPFFP
jgi:hypothetical protein